LPVFADRLLGPDWTVQGDLGDDRLGGEHADAGDLVQSCNGVEGDRAAGRHRRRLRCGDLGNQLLDAQGQHVDLGA
jgi:hypothetical protein